MTRDERTCRDVVHATTDYLERAMSAGDRAAFERHLSGCVGCVAYLDTMRATIALAASLHDGAATRVPRALRDAFRATRARPS